MAPRNEHTRLYAGLLVITGVSGLVTNLFVYGPTSPEGVATGTVIYGLVLVAAVVVVASRTAREHARSVLIATALLIAGTSALKLMGWRPDAYAVWLLFVGMASALTVGSLARRWTLVVGHGLYFQALLALGALVTSADPVLLAALSGAMAVTTAGVTFLTVLRHRTEAALQAARDEAERQQSLAERASLIKGEFLASMSHEIRTPMNGVVGMADLLSFTALDPEQEEYVETIRGCADALLTLLNDILDLSKIQAEGVTLESVAYAPAEVARQAVAVLRPGAEAKGLALAVDLDPSLPAAVLGDPTRVGQVLLNLVSNAIKFTSEGRVTVTMAAPAPGRLRVQVQDTGIGIPSDRLEAIFGAFTQADASTTREYGGTGLGLAISVRLAERMGGGLSVESQVGRGSTFTLDVDAPPTVDERPFPAPRAVRVAAEPIRVLVAEDDAVNRRVVTKLLDKLGYGDVEVVQDGAAAVEALHRAAGTARPVDVVLMDVQMPHLDGLQATRRLRRDLAPEHQPAVWVLTANAMSEDREAAHAAGADGFLTKPIDRGALADALASCRPLAGAPPLAAALPTAAA